MNAKQTVPMLAALAPLAAAAPPLIIGGLIGGAILLLLKAVLSDSKEAKLEAAAVEASVESRKVAETSAFRQIPAEITDNPPAIPLVCVPRALVASSIVPLVREVSVPVSALKRRMVGRQDMAAVFSGGRTLNRTEAVAALKRLGFGKTAAYSALSPDGRFSVWLRCAPDGAITWTDGHGT